MTSAATKFDPDETRTQIRTLRKRMQSERELLEAFVRKVPAAVAMLDPSFCFVHVSQRYIETFGLEALGEVRGMHLEEVFPPERNWDRPYLDDFYHAARLLAEGEELACEYVTAETVTGADVPVRFELVPFEFDNGARHRGGYMVLAELVEQRPGHPDQPWGVRSAASSSARKRGG